MEEELIQNVSDFYRQAEPLITRFEAFAQKHELYGQIVPDHIGYKCGSRTSFEKIRALFEQEGSFIYSSLISGRTIAYVRLKSVIISRYGPVGYLELCDQNSERSQRSGFDHIEAYPTGWSYEDMVSKLGQTEEVIKKERPHHTTHDIDIGQGFRFRATHEPLIEKIVREEILKGSAS